MSNDGIELVESKTLRSRHLAKVDVLGKVATLAMLPGNEFATTKQVAAFYSVPEKTITSVVVDHRDELEANGYAVLKGEFVNSLRESAKLSSRTRSLAVFSRTAVLNVGMLLAESEVARKVRAYLLAVEATAAPEHKATAIELIRLQERQDYKNILSALKQGRAVSGDDYRMVQNSLYMGLFGKTAAQIRATQKQRTGEYYIKQPNKLRPSKVAKDYLTADQLRLLDAAVLASTAQLQARYPNGTSVAEMVEVVRGSVALVRPRRPVAS
jgi:hypothetical protein